MSIGAKLKLNHLFGLKSDVHNNVHYLNETKVLYPVGHNVVIYDTEKREQVFISGSDGALGIDALAVTPRDKKTVAIAEHRKDETGAFKAFVNLWDVTTLRKRRHMSCPDVTSEKYMCVSFSNDGKYVLALSGPEDQKLVCWTV